MKAILLACLVMAASCGGDDGELDCSADDRRGTWLIRWEERSGNCGPVPDAVVIIDDAAAEGCAVISQEVSADECRVTSRAQCGGVEMQGIVDQVSRDRLEGLITAGDGQCLSTYRVVYTRQ